MASGQPPAARWERTRATSASLGLVLVTAAIAVLIASADCGSAENASSSAISVTSSLVSSRAEQGEERHVVVLRHAFRIAGPEPADDLGNDCRSFHISAAPS